jgi:hypothetical protein
MMPIHSPESQPAEPAARLAALIQQFAPEAHDRSLIDFRTAPDWEGR